MQNKIYLCSGIFVEINYYTILANYELFKGVFGFETYLVILHPKARNMFCKFRCSSHCLKIERGDIQIL